MKALMFPGQGAQRIGMGAGLFDKYPELVSTADSVLSYSVRELCLDGPMDRLTRTQFTQPALFVVNALSYLQHIETSGEPDYLLGHSVSEYVALFAAGVIDFETGVRLVHRRGTLMGQAQNGTMAAVLGLTSEQVDATIREHSLQDVYAANVNTPKQVVVSGATAAIQAAESVFLKAGASRYKVLAVSGAFHSPFMAEARDEFAGFAAKMTFNAPRIQVLSNVTARPHTTQDLRERMVEQIVAPVRWAESIRYLLAKGLAFADFIEIGPEGASVVRPMVKRTELEAGPLDPAVLAQEEEAMQAAAAATQQSAVAASNTRRKKFSADTLGSRAFCDAFGLRYAYVGGAMYRGIASTDLVIRLGRAGLLGFFGAAGLSVSETRHAVQQIKASLPEDAPFGVNFISHIHRPYLEDQLTDLLLEQGVRVVEASAFTEVTAALVRYRAKGLMQDGTRVRARNKVIAKVSRPDVAAQFLSAAPQRILDKLCASGAINADEAERLSRIPMADAICVESDSGGHTDQGMPFNLVPAILQERDQAQARFPDFGPIFVGAGGGIGSPEAAASVFVLGADFIVTGSVNQCTVEAGTSDMVKDILQSIDVQDTTYAPSGEMFELGSKVQVVKKGLFFPTRADKLVSLYRQHNSLDEISPQLKQQIQDKYFKRTFEQVFADVSATYPASETERAQLQPKHYMGLVFKRYFRDTSDWAMSGDARHKVDFQVHCGPAMGAFNRWVAQTGLASWRDRHVDEVALHLLEQTAALLDRRFTDMA
ncbi:MAG: ACP S-malonyltransferase [Pseudomonadota bacterium]